MKNIVNYSLPIVAIGLFNKVIQTEPKTIQEKITIWHNTIQNRKNNYDIDYNDINNIEHNLLRHLFVINTSDRLQVLKKRDHKIDLTLKKLNLEHLNMSNIYFNSIKNHNLEKQRVALDVLNRINQDLFELRKEKEIINYLIDEINNFNKIIE